MKGLRHFRWVCFLVMLATPFLLLADQWTQTDWSGGDGHFFWEEPAGYWVGNGVNGWRISEQLLLFAPDFGKFVSIGNPGGAYAITSLESDDNSSFYAGTEEDTAEVLISRDYGASWDTTATFPQPFPTGIHSIFITKLGYLLAGTEPAKIYRTPSSGDSSWEQVHLIHSSQGTVSDFAEVDFNLYATTVRGANDLAKVYKSWDFGNTWSADTFEQPEISGIAPAAIHELVLSEDSSFFASTYYTNYGARIFRYLSCASDWELCANLPDTTRKPIALDMGYDTLGGYGALYVGVGSDSGKVFRSTDEGDSWSSCAPLVNTRLVEGIVVDKDGAVYAACQTKRGLNDQVRVFRSLDMGTSWDTSAVIGGGTVNRPTSFHQTKKGFLLLGTALTGEVFKAAYMDSGYLESSVYDMGTGNGSSELGVIWWQESLNGQFLGIKVRTDFDSLMGNAVPWDLCIYCTNGQDISSLPSATDGHQYIQYLAEFKTNDINFSASLQKITIEFEIDSAAPQIDTAFASDGDSAAIGIDADDFVMLVFSDSTTEPSISPSTINTVLALNNGHSWWDEDGFVSAHWLSAESLKVEWPGLVGTPTVSVGDSIFPDTATIVDRWGNASSKPAVLAGSFDPPGIGEDGESGGPYADRVLIFPSIASQYLTAFLNLDKNCRVKMEMFDVTGRFVCTLFENQLSKGTHTIGLSPQTCQTGVYFIKIAIDGQVWFRKVVFVK